MLGDTLHNASSVDQVLQKAPGDPLRGVLRKKEKRSRFRTLKIEKIPVAMLRMGQSEDCATTS